MRLIDADKLKGMAFKSDTISEDLMIWADDIDTAPTIDPVRHGHWDGDKCSICHESYMAYADADSWPAIGEPVPNYCPDCGAKMDGGDDHA